MCPRSGDMEYQLNNTPNRRQLLLLIVERAEAEPHQAESFISERWRCRIRRKRSHSQAATVAVPNAYLYADDDLLYSYYSSGAHPESWSFRMIEYLLRTHTIQTFSLLKLKLIHKRVSFLQGRKATGICAWIFFCKKESKRRKHSDNSTVLGKMIKFNILLMCGSGSKCSRATQEQGPFVATDPISGACRLQRPAHQSITIKSNCCFQPSLGTTRMAHVPTAAADSMYSMYNTVPPH